jgi:hypothetical protein
MSLLESTQKLLDQVSANFTIREIADLSGGKVKFEWLRKFAEKEIADPGVTKIESLHEHLKKLNRAN